MEKLIIVGNVEFLLDGGDGFVGIVGFGLLLNVSVVVDNR